MLGQYLASLEVDQRQRLILQADKLQEMLGASRLIEQTVEVARRILAAREDIKLVTPVSGVLRFQAADLQELGQFLWELRLEIVEKLHLPSTFTIQAAKDLFKPSVDGLEERVRGNKDAKTGEVSRPASPLFAQCQIQPHLSANIWTPKDWRNTDKRRRSLVSHESEQREDQAGETFSEQFQNFAALQEFRKKHASSVWNVLPKEFADLATGSEDSYVAFVKADGDGMGRLLMQLDWDKLRPGAGADACREFSEAVERCLNDSTKTAVDEVTNGREYSKHNRFPVAPLVRAGEDYWIVCRRNLAFPLAIALGNAYAELASTGIIEEARSGVADLKDERLTLSFGILFAKQGFPFEAQLHMAEALVKSAKRFRSQHQPEPGKKTGCLDYYWLESSAREDVIEYRDSTLRIRDGAGEFLLYTTPWTLPEAQSFWNAAEKLKSAKFPSRKLKQLETILRLGADFSDLAFEQWRRMLRQGEWESLVAALKLLPARFPMTTATAANQPFLPMVGDKNNHWTPLLDLLKVVEIQEMHT
jgi:hypothetical protein